MNHKDFNEDFLIKYSKTIHTLLSAHEEISKYKFIEFLLVLNDKFSVDILRKAQFLIDPKKIQLLIPMKESVRLENASKIISFMKKYNKSFYIEYCAGDKPDNCYDIFTYDLSSDLFIWKQSIYQFSISFKPITITVTEFIYRITPHVLIDMVCREIYCIFNKDYDWKFLRDYR